MAPTRRKTDHILARVNFPLYCVQMLTNRHVIVGGGGGSSKTGIANGFEIFELCHNGKHFVAEEVTRHETGLNAVMNCCAFSDTKRSVLLAGLENYCQFYQVHAKVQVDEHTEEIDGRDAHQSKSGRRDTNENESKRLKFLLSPLDSVQTDVKGSEPLLKVVRVHRTGRIMATGGTDGVVKMWQFPNLNLLKQCTGHEREIDDLDFSDTMLASVAKDGYAMVWDCVKGLQIHKFTWKAPNNPNKYIFKRCRFGRIESEEKQWALHVLVNPTGPSKGQKSYLQSWGVQPNNGKLMRMTPYDESLSALAVRDDGRFVAVGTMFSGSVAIHAAFSLQRMMVVRGAHSMFVTGLEFLPVSDDCSYLATSVAEAAVISISVDNHVCIHTLPYRRTMPAYVAVIILIMALFVAFMACSYMGI